MLANFTKSLFNVAPKSPIFMSMAQAHLPSWYPDSRDMKVIKDRKYTYRLDISGGVRHAYDVRLEKRDVVVRGRVMNKEGESRVRKIYNFVRRHRLPDDVILHTVQTKSDPRGFVTVSAAMRRKKD